MLHAAMKIYGAIILASFAAAEPLGDNLFKRASAYILTSVDSISLQYDGLVHGFEKDLTALRVCRCLLFGFPIEFGLGV
jgi:hypothetical protein